MGKVRPAARRRGSGAMIPVPTRPTAIRTAREHARRRWSRRAATRGAPGFSYTELLVCLGIVGVVTVVVVPLVGRTRATAQGLTCVAHLRQIGTGFVQYAADNDKRLPDPFEMQVSWEQILRKYLPEEGVFRCPADGEVYPSVGSSYDWRDTGFPETTLAGKLITDTNRPDPVLAFEALPGWHVRGRMNAVTLSGAASAMDQEACLEDLQLPIRPVIENRSGSGKGSTSGGAADKRGGRGPKP